VHKAWDKEVTVRVLGWLYRIVLNLIMLGIAYAVIGAAHTQFETVVACVLVLIYTGVVWAHTSISISLSGVEKANYARFLELRTLAGQPTQAEEREELSAISKKLNRPGAAFYINIAGLSVMSLLATIQLIAALLRGAVSE
jgi:hypothetical protein